MFHTPTRALIAGAIVLALLAGAALAMPAHAQDSDQRIDDDAENASTAAAGVSAHELATHNDSSLSVHASSDGERLVIDVEYTGDDAAVVEIASDGDYAPAGTHSVRDEQTFRLDAPTPPTEVAITVEGDRTRVGFVWRPASWGDCFDQHPYVVDSGPIERLEDGEWVSVVDRPERPRQPPVDPCSLVQRMTPDHPRFVGNLTTEPVEIPEPPEHPINVSAVEQPDELRSCDSEIEHPDLRKIDVPAVEQSDELRSCDFEIEHPDLRKIDVPDAEPAD